MIPVGKVGEGNGVVLLPQLLHTCDYFAVVCHVGPLTYEIYLSLFSFLFICEIYLIIFIFIYMFSYNFYSAFIFFAVNFVTVRLFLAY